MSHADFQDRLHRINSKEPEQKAAEAFAGHIEQPVQTKKNFGLIAIAAIFVSIATIAGKSVFEDFDAMLEAEAWGALGLSLAVTLVSVFVAHRLLKRAIPAKKQVVEKRVRASSRAKTVSSIIGIIFGTIGGFYVVLGDAVSQMDTEQAKILDVGGTTVAVLLVLLSLLLGFIGLFAKRLALGRIPIYCLVSTIMFVTGFRMSGADLTDFATLTLATMQ